MKFGPIWQKMYHRGLLRMAAVTGVVTQLGDCDNTEVTTAVLAGLNEFVVALVDAFFIAIRPIGDNTPPVTTWLFDAAGSFLC